MTDSLTHKPFDQLRETMQKEGFRSPPRQKGNGQQMHQKHTASTRQAPQQTVGAGPRPPEVPMPANMPGLPMVIATPYKRVAVETLLKGAIYTVMGAAAYSIASTLLNRKKPAT